MLVLSSPSGAGKSTISRRLMIDDDNLVMSISATTRPPRPGEVDGEHYFFVNRDRFRELVEAGGFLEHATVFGHSYGTPREPAEKALIAGRDVLFDVDWQGTQQLRHSAGRDLVSIFILPPSHEELERRLYARAQDPREVVKNRMDKAASEMSHWDVYDYVIVNEVIQDSVRAIIDILTVERRRRERQIWLPDFVSKLCEDK